MNIAILFSDFGPYHITRIKSLANAGSHFEMKLYAFRFSERSNTYSWKPESPNGVEVITLGAKKPDSFYSLFRLSMNFRRHLIKENITVIFLPSYSPLTNFLCLLVAKSCKCKTILMNESWIATSKTNFFGALIKRLAVKSFDAALVGGSNQVEYAIKYGMSKDKIFTGYDVVDNAYFTSQSTRWKNAKIYELPVENMPPKFFLNIGRFVKKKNIETLIAAYVELIKLNPECKISLVLVGEGSEELRLKKLAKDSGLNVIIENESGGSGSNSTPSIYFYNFKQIDITSIFFSRCLAFILPSSYEEWGLVINEAMASGVPVIVSKRVGSGRDLVIEGKTGFTFNPEEKEELLIILKRFLDDTTLSSMLGNAAQQHIRNYDPAIFGINGLKAIKSILEIK